MNSYGPLLELSRGCGHHHGLVFMHLCVPLCGQLHYYKQGKNDEFVRLLEASRTGKAWSPLLATTVDHFLLVLACTPYRCGYQLSRPREGPDDVSGHVGCLLCSVGSQGEGKRTQEGILCSGDDKRFFFKNKKKEVIDLLESAVGKGRQAYYWG